MHELPIASLPDFNDLLPNVRNERFPEDLSVLFNRSELGIMRDGQQGIVVFRNKDLVEIAAHPAIGMVSVDDALRLAGFTAEQHPSIRRFARNLVFASNPPVHKPMRQIIARPLMPKQLPPLESTARLVVAELVERAIEQGTFDFYAAITRRATVGLWAPLLQLSEVEVEQILLALHDMTPLLFFTRTPEETLSVNVATARYLDLVSNAVDRSVNRETSGFLHSLKDDTTESSSFSNLEFPGDWIAANLFDAFHTAAVGSANVAFQLLSSPEAFATVRGRPELAVNAVSEGLRLSPPLTVTMRQALVDLQYAGISIPRGTSISMLWAAGCRDPRVHKSPNTYDLYRKPRNELTFGGGAHICPGRYLAKMLAQVVVEQIVAPEISLTLNSEPPPRWIPRSFSRQLDQFKVIIERRH